MRICSSIVSVLILITSFGLASAQDKMQEVDLGFMTITMPSSFVDQKAKGTEGGYWKFAGEGFLLHIDHNAACYRPTFERRDPVYDMTEEFLTIDGYKAVIWSKRGGTFTAGANYKILKDDKIGLGIYLDSKDDIREQTKELARKIFLSVKFRK
jgi:hypothetical protein